MRTPFTADQFFNVFAQYNQGVWPNQVGLIAIALLAIGLATWAPRHTRMVMAILTALWAWMAVAYHVLFFARINPLAYPFAVLFLFQAGVLAWHGLKTGRLALANPAEGPARIGGAVLMGYALVVYPAIALAVGQRYPAMPTFGLPCPTTIFTLGILLWCKRPFPWIVLVVPGFWAVIATSAAVSLGVVEDYALPLAAALVIGVRMWTGSARAMRAA